MPVSYLKDNQGIAVVTKGDVLTVMKACSEMAKKPELSIVCSNGTVLEGYNPVSITPHPAGFEIKLLHPEKPDQPIKALYAWDASSASTAQPVICEVRIPTHALPQLQKRTAATLKHLARTLS